MKLFAQTRIPLLSKALDAYALRHRAIASNVANVGTPGYRARTVEFEQELAGAMGRASGTRGVRTHERHIPIGRGSVEEMRLAMAERDGGTAARPGMSNVDIDHEMAELAQNQIRYRFSARLIADAFRGIQKSIRGTT